MKKTSLLFLLSIAALATGCGNPASVNSDTSSNDSNTADNGNGSSTSTPTSGSETPSSGEQTPSSTGSEVTPSTGEATPSESGSETPSTSGETTPTGGESTPSTVEPSESTEPTEVVPSTPVVPTETEPVEPTEPTEPVVPTEPTEPTEVVETSTPSEVIETPTQGMPESSEDGWSIIRGEPEVGKSYRLGLDRKDASQNPTIWWMQDQTQKEANSSTGKDYYLMSADDVSDGAVVEVIAANNGFKLKVGERYLQITKSGNYVNNYLKSNASDASVFTYSNIHDAIGLTVDGSFYGSGVKGDKTFTTIGALNFDDFADAFKVNLYYNPDEVLPVDPTEVVPSTPVVPTETEPVEPTEPTEPVVPTEPTEPVVPTEPTEPVEETPTPSEIKDPNDYSATVLVYICGSNLESDGANKDSIYYQGYYYDNDYLGEATRDIQEMVQAQGQPDNVNIVLETGGANAWTRAEYGLYGDYDISASKLQRHHIVDNHLELDETLETYKSMGLSSTLQSFLEFGLTNYPADKTSLILWNHGGAMSGVCFDEKKSNDGLTNKEVSSAVKNALKNTGHEGEKLEWIGYDACLMGIQDIAYTNSQYFNYMVCSEQLESGTGWDYDEWLDDLYAKKPTTEVLTEISDTFIAENGGSSSQNDQTLSVLDLSKAEAYKTAWENMAAQLKNKINSNNSDDFGELVKKAKTFDEDYGVFDAKDFVNRLASNSTFKPGKTYTDAVTKALSELVIKNGKGGGAGNANGIAFIFNVSSYFDASNWYSTSQTSFTNWRYIVITYPYDPYGGWGSWGW